RTLTISSMRVFSYPRSRKSRCEVLTISCRSLAFLRARRPGVSGAAAATGGASFRFRKPCRLRSPAVESVEDSRDLLLARAISEENSSPSNHRPNYDGHSNILVTHVKLRAPDHQQAASNPVGPRWLPWGRATALRVEPRKTPGDNLLFLKILLDNKTNGRAIISVMKMRHPQTKVKRTRGLKTRNSILRTAVSIASVEGLEGLTIGKLATELGISKSGLFAHFGSKEELQLAVVEAARQLFVERVILPAQGEKGMKSLRTLYENWIPSPDGKTFPGGCFFQRSHWNSTIDRAKCATR